MKVAGLTTKFEFFEQLSILLDVTLADVVKHSTAAPDHQQKTTTTVVIFCMCLQVFRQAVDSVGQ